MNNFYNPYFFLVLKPNCTHNASTQTLLSSSCDSLFEFSFARFNITIANAFHAFFQRVCTVKSVGHHSYITPSARWTTNAMRTHTKCTFNHKCHVKQKHTRDRTHKSQLKQIWDTFGTYQGQQIAFDQHSKKPKRAVFNCALVCAEVRSCAPKCARCARLFPPPVWHGLS